MNYEELAATLAAAARKAGWARMRLADMNRSRSRHLGQAEFARQLRGNFLAQSGNLGERVAHAVNAPQGIFGAEEQIADQMLFRGGFDLFPGDRRGDTGMLPLGAD